MKHSIIILSLCFLFSSCASILNGPTTYINVKTTQPSLIISNSDTVETNKRNKALLTVDRSPEPILLTTLSDSLEGKITINPVNSIAYKYNIFTLGVGALIERGDYRRYAYPMLVKIDPADTTNRVYDNFNTPKKGSLYLNATFPYINNFYFKPDNKENKSSTGFLGSAIGLDYYYRDDKFVNFSIIGVMDFFIPFPAPIDYASGEYEFFSSSHITITNNHRISKFSMGYGLCFVKNSWRYREYDDLGINSIIQEIDRSHSAIGFNFPIYYQIGKTFYIGLIYRPTFYRFNIEESFNYEHLVSLDFAWKFRLKQ